MGPGLRRDDIGSPRGKFLRQHQNLARARDAGPVAVEVGDQPLHVVAVHGALQRSLVGEFIGRLMQRGIANAPEPPRFPGAEHLCRVGQMLPAVPDIKRRAPGRVGDGGADDEIG